MEVQNFTTKVIKASEGKFLTQVDDTVSIESRITSDTIALGKNDSAENYKEISEEEANEIRKKQEEYVLEKQRKA